MAIDEARDLPLYGRLGEMARLLSESGALVLSAEPGAGKTSLAPLAVAGMLPGTRALGEGKVIVVEPRRVAALAAAGRMAAIAGARAGGEVGYRVRGEASVGAAARVVVVTPGVLVRMLQDDPDLPGLSCVVLDEFHERSAQADLAAALLMEARQYRPGLLLLAMSATIDSARAAERLGAAAMEVPGRSFPIETRHAPIAEGRGRSLGRGPGFEEDFARSALGLAEEAEGDVLAFLPGAAEIGRVAEACERLGRGRAEAVRLHGSMPLALQARAIAPPPDAPRRIVLATSVAETSLTVARVRAVLDSGLARITRFHRRSGFNRLVTELEARDRADQRRGRAGRLGPGLCVRAWSAAEALAERTEPEIFRSELSGLALEAAVWGARGRLGLPWIDEPPEAAWSAAIELLAELGALDPSGAATGLGRRMARLGTEPRLAALVLRGAAEGEARTACLAAALLSERGGADGERDLALRLESLESGARDPNGSAVLAEADRLARAAGVGPGGAVRPSALGSLLASAFPDRVARRLEYRGTDASFQVAGGRALRATGALASAEWIVAVEADAGDSEGTVFSGCAIDARSALAALEPMAREDVSIEWRGLSCRALRARRALSLQLGRAEALALGQGQVAAALASRIASEGLGFLPWDEGGAGALLARLRWLAAARAAASGPDGAERDGAERDNALGDFGEASLASSAAEWLGPFAREGGNPAMDGGRLRSAIEALIPRGLRAALEREAPGRLDLPSGSSRQIDYGSPGAPSAEAKVQEFFGLSEHPRIGPRPGVPLVLRLLDPGGKPLQVTSDLPGFWKGGWAEARKQLRGRYPRHEWPEDPARAAPSRTGIKKKGARD